MVPSISNRIYIPFSFAIRFLGPITQSDHHKRCCSAVPV
jgi:hypothetical protein